ncbi:uncharacterized protein GGS22DRAFT_190386 [Annulohypoxylon maeteangense]|uniref:uncharacterized protein n=1 Tax=Annulohypoxylon maeteangense TaxID=1927788 RepID=UPI0020086349|nr:uncharacterized protein GGS22DRAFT_190386 [Annulohypoxylon maeteangense]KAI0883078.1 hypothetical protein GGS22DRAFT_190386 [Annulohypoxylon maeteangense]
MAVPNLSMPSFELTRAERIQNEEHVNNLVHHSIKLLNRYKKKSSMFDLIDASVAIEDAIAIARDPGACESPPLAKCYLNQGHILKAMEQYPEARIAYLRAASIPSHNPIDRAVSQKAANWVAQMDQKIRDAKRKGGIWPDIYRQTTSSTDPGQCPSELLTENLRNIDIYRTQPLLKEVGVRKPSIEKSQHHNLQRLQDLIRSSERRMTEMVSTPGLDHRGMLFPTSPLRSFKEHLAMRHAATKKP